MPSISVLDPFQATRVSYAYLLLSTRHRFVGLGHAPIGASTPAHTFLDALWDQPTPTAALRCGAPKDRVEILQPVEE